MAIDPQLAYENAQMLAGAAREASTDVILNMEGSERTETISPFTSGCASGTKTSA